LFIRQKVEIGKYNLSSLKEGEITKAKLGRVGVTVFGQSEPDLIIASGEIPPKAGKSIEIVFFIK